MSIFARIRSRFNAKTLENVLIISGILLFIYWSYTSGVRERKEEETKKIQSEKEYAEMEKKWEEERKAEQLKEDKCRASTLFNESSSIIQRSDFNECMEYWLSDNDYIDTADAEEYVNF